MTVVYFLFTLLRVNFDFYFRDVLLPLQAEIKNLHQLSGFEEYSEVSGLPRAIASGKHLFSADYLDPLHSMRGNYTSVSQAQIALGKMLFYDPILSNNNALSCASCHKSNFAFTDAKAKSIGTNGESVLRNAPTLINSGFQSSFFWDLRSKDMNHQILKVIENHNEFNTTANEIIEKISSIPQYNIDFKKAFPSYDKPVIINVLKTALEIYMRSLVNNNAKFDKNIRAEINILSLEEQNGFNVFYGKGACATFHFPPHFNGWVPPHFEDTEGEILGLTESISSMELDNDLGLYDLFKLNYPDAMAVKGMFKTPSLRNIGLSVPYMHNGGFSTLEEVMEFYNHGGGAGKGLAVPQQTLSADSLNLTNIEIASLVKFLNCLTDTANTQVRPFVSPKSSNPNLNNRVWGGK